MRHLGQEQRWQRAAEQLTHKVEAGGYDLTPKLHDDKLDRVAVQRAATAIAALWEGFNPRSAACKLLETSRRRIVVAVGGSKVKGLQVAYYVTSRGYYSCVEPSDRLDGLLEKPFQTIAISANNLVIAAVKIAGKRPEEVLPFMKKRLDRIANEILGKK